MAPELWSLPQPVLRGLWARAPWRLRLLDLPARAPWNQRPRVLWGPELWSRLRLVLQGLWAREPLKLLLSDLWALALLRLRLLDL